MPGFWEQLQQYAQQDQMRQANAQAKQFQIAQMMSDAVNSDRQNAQVYGSMEQQGLSLQSGLMKAIFEAQQGDRNSVNSIANSQSDRNLTREEGVLNRQNALGVAQTKANVDQETWLMQAQISEYMRKIQEKEALINELKSKPNPVGSKGIPSSFGGGQ